MIDEKTRERFWAKVRKTRGCWVWEGFRHRNGYGQFQIAGHHSGAHRISWEIAHGPIPRGMQCHHKCDVPACVNPAHLWLGTQVENLADAARKGRLAYGERNGAAKLKEAQVREIRRAARKGKRQVELARAYGVTGSVISTIIHRKAWRHIA